MSDMKCPNIKIYKCSDGFVTDNAQVAKSHEANIKSNKLICPFCGQKLESFFVENRSVFACCNLNCKGYFMNAPKELWQELIRTRKALEIALDALDTMVIDDNISGIFARNAIKQIKALEQKE